MTAVTPSPPPHEAFIDVFVARQPIFDRAGSLFAYELLYRRTSAHTVADGVTPDVMASEVLVQAFLNFGIDRMTGGHRAFLNFTRDMLLRGMYQLFDPSQVVIELLETVEPDAEVVAAARAMVEAGYTLALDDFEFDPAYEPLLRLATIIKLDVLGKAPEELRSRHARVAAYGGMVLAERVETAEMRAQCEAAGYDLFQGYFFSKPETLTRRDLSTGELTILRLMNLLRDPDTSDLVLEEAFRADVSLTYKLLRSVNSALLGGRGIESIRHAVRLVGRGELHKWLSLLLVTSVARKGGIDAELVQLAIQRARLCELVAQQGRDRRSAEPLFVVGLFSLLDALLRIPLREILDRVDLADEVRRALVARSGPYAPTLAMVEAYERADWPVVEAECATLGVDAATMGALYVEAVRWTRARLFQEP